MPNVQIPLVFRDNKDTITLKDKAVVEKIPVIVNALSCQNSNWETEETILDKAIEIPFLRESGEFLFSNVVQYKSPDAAKEFSKPEDYPEAMRKDLEELKDIIELANFMECTDFVQAMGFVIAKKLEDKSVEEIAAYMGVEVLNEDDGYDEDNEWMHPPSSALQKSSEK